MDGQPVASRFALVQGALFSAGVVTLFLSVFASTPTMLLVSGPCLFASGVLIAFGARITLAGPLGAIMRSALGGPRVKLLWLRAVVWTVVGVLVTLYGVERVAEARETPPAEPAPGQWPSASLRWLPGLPVASVSPRTSPR